MVGFLPFVLIFHISLWIDSKGKLDIGFLLKAVLLAKAGTEFQWSWSLDRRWSWTVPRWKRGNGFVFFETMRVVHVYLCFGPCLLGQRLIQPILITGDFYSYHFRDEPANLAMSACLLRVSGVPACRVFAFCPAPFRGHNSWSTVTSLLGIECLDGFPPLRYAGPGLACSDYGHPASPALCQKKPTNELTG